MKNSFGSLLVFMGNTNGETRNCVPRMNFLKLVFSVDKKCVSTRRVQTLGN